MESHGHTKADARRIKDLIESYQHGAGSGPAPASNPPS
jgi:hypothetical protein